jgi:hypothetical protein
MSTQTTQDDAMRAVLPGISPGGLLEAIENPDVIRKTCLADYYVQLGMLRQLAASSAFTVSQRLEYMKLLARVGGIDRPSLEQIQHASLPSINIVLPGLPDQSVEIQGRVLSSLPYDGDDEGTDE